MKLNLNQRKALSEISGNVAVAWFSAGVISPLFLKTESIIKLIILTIASLTMAILFTLVSLFLMKVGRV